jgi:Na+/H+-translocating membrane pyrophosphatase
MKKIGIEIKWGILFAVIQLLWMLAERQAGLHDENIEHHALASNFFAIVAIIIYVFALLDKRKNDLSGKMTWKQGFFTGLIITAVVTFLTPLTQYLTSTVITPNHFVNMISYSVETGKMTQEAAEAYFNLKNYMVQSLIFTPVIGIVTSAIVAIFTRKK